MSWLLVILVSLFTPAGHVGPCHVEDDHNCYWLAAERGNGQGGSFIDLNGWRYGIR